MRLALVGRSLFREVRVPLWSLLESCLAQTGTGHTLTFVSLRQPLSRRCQIFGAWSSEALDKTEDPRGGTSNEVGNATERARRSNSLPVADPKVCGSKGGVLFVPAEQVMAVAEREKATPYDVKGVELGHHGKECSFDAILKKHCA